MKSVIIFSDTHGNVDLLKKFKEILKETDYIIHLGDNKRDIDFFAQQLGDKIYSVYGNCDGAKGNMVFEIEGLKFFITHGHEYGVKSSLDRLIYAGKEVGANVICYGHTHVSNIECVDGITLINPGCMERGSKNSYCYAVVHGSKIIPKIVEIN